MADIFKPLGYHFILGKKDTQIAIKACCDYFETNLARELRLIRVLSPMVEEADGKMDNTVSFEMAETGKELSIINSFEKWMRYAVADYGFENGEGLYSEIRTVFPEEKTDNLHSIFTDQWVWEKVISKEDRTISTLKHTVRKIYDVLKMTEKYMNSLYPQLKIELSEEITFVTAQELEDLYPDNTPKEREYLYSKLKGAIFIMQIGGVLKSGQKHDGRVPDYDDWELNGDIVLYNRVLDCPFEISSMGIRVSEDSLKEQLKIAGCEDRLTMPFHRDLIGGKLPYTMGGGLGQSRICMFFLKKAHIGEVQASVWPEAMREECEDCDINLL